MNTAAKVRQRKEKYPEAYCADPKCLWSLKSGPCPKHPEADSEFASEHGHWANTESDRYYEAEKS
jgi:hypothetical protein